MPRGPAGRAPRPENPSALPLPREPDCRTPAMDDPTAAVNPDPAEPGETDDWTRRLLDAVRQRCTGDVLTLADEAATAARERQARCAAGRLLLATRQWPLARAQFERALQIDPTDDDARRALASAAQGCHHTPMDALAGPDGPRQVLLFSGHRIDEPGRTLARFTPAMLPAAAGRIADELALLQAGPDDLALCQAAAGGDLLFLEACRARGVRLQVLLPFAEAAFAERSILASIDGEAWLVRWQALRAALSTPPRAMPDVLGPGPPSGDPYERCNRWLLNTALAFGPHRLRLLCLWNGLDGDGRGGVQHMVEAVRGQGGRVHWIDTRTLGPA